MHLLQTQWMNQWMNEYIQGKIVACMEPTLIQFNQPLSSIYLSMDSSPSLPLYSLTYHSSSHYLSIPYSYYLYNHSSTRECSTESRLSTHQPRLAADIQPTIIYHVFMQYHLFIYLSNITDDHLIWSHLFNQTSIYLPTCHPCMHAPSLVYKSHKGIWNYLSSLGWCHRHSITIHLTTSHHITQVGDVENTDIISHPKSTQNMQLQSSFSYPFIHSLMAWTLLLLSTMLICLLGSRWERRVSVLKED
jgi:hypothetical protein